MKFEYTYSTFGADFDMIIPGEEYKKIADDEHELNFLCFAVDAFSAVYGFANRLDPRAYMAVIKWLKKSSYVLFVAKIQELGGTLFNGWCEIYTITDGKIESIVFSEDGVTDSIRVPRLNHKR